MLDTSLQLVRGEDRTIGRALVACMVIGFLALIGVGLAAWWVTRENRVHGWWVSHSYEVRVATAETGLTLERGETARRGFLLTGQQPYLLAYRRYAARLTPSLDHLVALAADNPDQRRRIAKLRTIVAAIVAERERSVALVLAGHRVEAQARFAQETAARRLPVARAYMAALTVRERMLLQARDRDLARSQAAFNAVLAIAGLLVVVVAFVSLLTVLRFTRDLTASRDRLRRLNDTLEDEVAERTADLTRANEEIQRFAYIVSHDLRSPLVNVMGFTAELSAATAPLGELVDRVEEQLPALLTEEARLAAREDLPEAIGFIRTSTQKMDRLINAILKLSREGRRVVAPESLDIAGIAEGAVDAIRHLVDDRGVTVVVERPMPPLTSDRLALEQILSNLIENATKYLQPGRPGRITVSARGGTGRVVIAVADNGRGIDPRDHSRVFDLFRRSGTQDQPGEGIGLAHVRALAYRLGGTIDVQSQLGEGSTFRVTLPQTFQPAQDAS